MISLPGKIFLAPMAELSTPALRHVIKELYPETVLYSEMLSAGAIAAGAPHNEPLVTLREFDNPLIFQLVGANPSVMADACAILSETKCYGVDINMGCPNHDIVKKGQGAMLLTDIKKARSIVRSCRKATLKPLSVKMRSGYEGNDESSFIDFIVMLEAEGVDFITLHPRFAKLGFRRTADWRLVALAKRHLSIPVIGNGDITTPEAAIIKIDETGCDGVMIGREAVTSPWIFRLIADCMSGRSSSLELDVRDIFLKTLGYMHKYLPERLHRSRSHRFCAYYTRNVRYGHDLFTKIRRESAIGPVMGIVEEYYDRNPEEAIRHYFIEGGCISNETPCLDPAFC
ncbi:MAG: tRNA-dihydrouridine synthase family protein [Spirochaetes bacterium]|nr:tRNA-dihydrouridine synthase family protein [Spirochaetota bacterium]